MSTSSTKRNGYTILLILCVATITSREKHTLRICAEGSSPPMLPPRCSDIGCGTGPYFTSLAPLTSQLIGVEYAHSKARVARRRVSTSNTIVLVGSATEIPLRASSCHVVLCSEVIEHFPNPDEVLAELLRVTAPHGHVVISTPVRYDAATILRALAGLRNRMSRRLQKPDEHGHYWYFAPFDLERRLSGLGARFISFEVVPRIHFPGLPRLIRHHLVSTDVLSFLGRKLSDRGALADLGAFGVLVVAKVA